MCSEHRLYYFKFIKIISLITLLGLYCQSGKAQNCNDVYNLVTLTGNTCSGYNRPINVETDAPTGSTVWHTFYYYNQSGTRFLDEQFIYNTPNDGTYYVTDYTPPNASSNISTFDVVIKVGTCTETQTVQYTVANPPPPPSHLEFYIDGTDYQGSPTLTITLCPNQAIDAEMTTARTSNVEWRNNQGTLIGTGDQLNNYIFSPGTYEVKATYDIQCSGTTIVYGSFTIAEDSPNGGSAKVSGNSQGSVCEGGSQTISLTSYSGTITKWQRLAVGSTNWGNAEDIAGSAGQSSLSVTPTSDYQYRAAVRKSCSDNSTRTDYSVPATLTVFDKPNTPFANVGGSNCGWAGVNDPIEANTTAPSSSIVHHRYYKSNGTFLARVPASNVNTSSTNFVSEYLPPNLSASNKDFYVITEISSCYSDPRNVSYSVSNPPVFPGSLRFDVTRQGSNSITTDVASGSTINQCSNEPIQITAYAGTGSISNVTWTEPQSGTQSGATYSNSDPQPGTYTVSATWSNGCPGGTQTISGSITLGAITKMLTWDIEESYAICDHPAISVSVPGGSNASYTWQVDGEVQTSTSANLLLGNLSVGDHTIRCTVEADFNDCSVRQTIAEEKEVTAYGQILSVEAGPDLSIALGSTPVFLYAATPSGGLWSGSIAIDGDFFDPTTTRLTEGTYTLVYSVEESGCLYSDTRVVTVISEINDHRPTLGCLTKVATGYQVNIQETDITTYDYYWQTTALGTDDDPSNNDLNRIFTAGGTYYLRAQEKTVGGWGPALVVVIPDLSDPVLSQNVDQTDVSYVRTFTFWTENGSSDPISASPNEVQTTTQYLDGLGRPFQTVVKQGSYVENDVVQVYAYDAIGRERKAYLPYEASSQTGLVQGQPYQDQQAFYSSTSPSDVASSDYPFSYTHYEASPLNRVLAQAARVKNGPG